VALPGLVLSRRGTARGPAVRRARTGKRPGGLPICRALAYAFVDCRFQIAEVIVGRQQADDGFAGVGALGVEHFDGWHQEYLVGCGERAFGSGGAVEPGQRGGGADGDFADDGAVTVGRILVHRDQIFAFDALAIRADRAGEDHQNGHPAFGRNTRVGLEVLCMNQTVCRAGRAGQRHAPC